MPRKNFPPALRNRGSGAVQNMHNIAVLHDIPLAFDPKFSGRLDGRLAAIFLERGHGIDLGADKFLLKIGVNRASAPQAAGAVRAGPPAPPALTRVPKPFKSQLFIGYTQTPTSRLL